MLWDSYENSCSDPGASVKKNSPQIHGCSDAPPWLLKTGTLNTWVSSLLPHNLELGARWFQAHPPNFSWTRASLSSETGLHFHGHLQRFTDQCAAMNFLVTWNVPLLEWGVPKVHNNTPTSKTTQTALYPNNLCGTCSHMSQYTTGWKRVPSIKAHFGPLKTSSLEASLDYRGETLVSINKLYLWPTKTPRMLLLVPTLPCGSPFLSGQHHQPLSVLVSSLLSALHTSWGLFWLSCLLGILSLQTSAWFIHLVTSFILSKGS